MEYSNLCLSCNRRFIGQIEFSNTCSICFINTSAKSQELLKLKNDAIEGKKFDDNKPDFSLLSPIAIEQIAKVMTKGQVKYGSHNWRNGIQFNRLYAAMQRHLNSWHSGDHKDPETGLSHLAHAACNLMMLLEFEVTKPELNNLYNLSKK